MSVMAKIQIRDDKVLKGGSGRGKWHVKRGLKKNEHGEGIVLLCKSKRVEKI